MCEGVTPVSGVITWGRHRARQGLWGPECDGEASPCVTGSMCVSLSVEGSPPRPEYDWVSPWWKAGMGPTRPPGPRPYAPAPAHPGGRTESFKSLLPGQPFYKHPHGGHMCVSCTPRVCTPPLPWPPAQPGKGEQAEAAKGQLVTA